jgi:hypothetical protein
MYIYVCVCVCVCVCVYIYISVICSYAFETWFLIFREEYVNNCLKTKYSVQ